MTKHLKLGEFLFWYLYLAVIGGALVFEIITGK